MNDNLQNDFEKAAEDQPTSLVREFLQFVIEHKAWWMIPILLSFGMIGLLVAFSQTAAAPFIYTLF